MSGRIPASRTELWSARRDGDALRLSGEIDMSNAAAVAERMLAEIGTGVVHLDLSAVEFCGAAGLRALLTGYEALRSRNRILRVTCSAEMLRMLRLCGLTELDGLRVIPAGESDDGEDEPGVHR